MKTVYVISSGCVYEGGGVDAVFLREDLANAKFNELLEQHRESNHAMEEYELEKDNRYSEVGEWLKEELTETEDIKHIVFHDMDYIQLRKWECEE